MADLSITKIDGEPTMQLFDRMMEELRPIAAKIKTEILPQGDIYGCLGLICTDEEYGAYIGDANYEFTAPEKPTEYDLSIPDNIGETERKMREALHSKRKVEYAKYIAANIGIRNIIEAAIDAEFIEELRDPIIGYDRLMPYDMLQHIRRNIALTTDEVKGMKATVFIEWEPATQTLRALINKMEQGTKGCMRWKIVIPEMDLVQHLVEQIYKAGVFEQTIMIKWENKKQPLKTWERCKDYFLKEYDSIRHFTKVTGAKQAGYHSAANATESNSSDADDKVEQFLDSYTKHSEEMNMVATTNAGLQAVIEQQTKQMQTLMEMNANLMEMVKKGGGNPAGNDAANAAQEKEAPKKEKKKCPYCGKGHKISWKYCLARKCNAHLRPDNWKGKEVDE